MYDTWTPLITLVQSLLIGAGGLGLIIAFATKATAATNEDRHAMSHKLISASIAGLLIGLLAQDIYNLIFGWL